MTLSLIIIIIIIIFVVYYEKKRGPTDYTNNKGIVNQDDMLKDSLDKIEWNSLRELRINYIIRYLFWGLWITFLGSFILLNSLPDSALFLQTWMIITIILVCLHGYYYWHSDKFSDLMTLESVEKIRSKIGINKSTIQNLKSKSNILEGSDRHWIFSHSDYIVGTQLFMDK